MATEKMELVNIIGLMGDLDKTLEECCESGCFHMETAVSSSNNNNLKLINEKNPYQTALKNFSSLAGKLEISLTETDFSKCEIDSPQDFENLYDSIYEQHTKIFQKRQKALQIIYERKAAKKQVKHLNGLNEDFDQIFACKHIEVRVGKLPVDNQEKLEYHKNLDFFFVPFDKDKNYCWGMYFCPQNVKNEVDNLFQSLYFERIYIPDFVKGNTQQAYERLNAEIDENTIIAEQAENDIKALIKNNEKTIQTVYSKLKYKNDVFELRRNVGELNGKFYIKGFVPKKNEEKFKKLFDDINSVSVVFMPPDADPCCTPPTILKNSWFTKPFGMLVEMYGLPNYGGFNPTTFVAITYALLFGIMFGDLGQGFVVFLAGFFISKKISKQAAISFQDHSLWQQWVK